MPQDLVFSGKKMYTFAGNKKNYNEKIPDCDRYCCGINFMRQR